MEEYFELYPKQDHFSFDIFCTTMEKDVWVIHKNVIMIRLLPFKVMPLGFIEGWCREQPYADGFCISYKIIFEGIIHLHYSVFPVKKTLSDILSQHHIRRKMFSVELICILSLLIKIKVCFVFLSWMPGSSELYVIMIHITNWILIVSIFASYVLFEFLFVYLIVGRFPSWYV